MKIHVGDFLLSIDGNNVAGLCLDRVQDILDTAEKVRLFLYYWYSNPPKNSLKVNSK